MIITRNKLQQIIDEEFSKALEKRRAALNESYFDLADIVMSNVDAQGLKKGQSYVIVDKEDGQWGTVMYAVEPVEGGKRMWIANGHLLLTPADPKDFYEEDF